MRQTGQTNLNLDMVNLLSYPPCKKLFGQLQKYPQEVIPTMDQILKDLMLEIADEDQQAAAEGMEGEQCDEEIADIMGKVYKVQPFGLKSVNTRELNPSGKLVSWFRLCDHPGTSLQIPTSSRVSSFVPLLSSQA